MCFPLLGLLAAGALAGGGVASYFGNKSAGDAQMAASNAERARQQDLSNQQTSVFNDSVAKAGNINGQGMVDAQAQRQAAFTAALAGRSPTQNFLPGSTSASNVVKDSSNQIVANQQADTTQHATASAHLQALGDSLFKTNIGITRNNQQIDQLGAQKQDSASVLPAELQAAATHGGFLRGIGSLLEGLGGAGLSGGLGGFGAGAAGGVAAPTVVI